MVWQADPRPGRPLAVTGTQSEQWRGWSAATETGAGASGTNGPLAEERGEEESSGMRSGVKGQGAIILRLDTDVKAHDEMVVNGRHTCSETVVIGPSLVMTSSGRSSSTRGNSWKWRSGFRSNPKTCKPRMVLSQLLK